MNLRLLKKDIFLILRNKPAILTIISVIILEIILVMYSRSVIGCGNESLTGVRFKYLQNYILVFYFPVIIVNILILAFSVTKEKDCFMLAKMLPFGESTFLRSKAASAVIIAVFLSFPCLFSGIYLCGLEPFQDLNFLIATSFYLLFFITGLSSFSVSYAVNYYECRNSYEPDVKGILGLMFFISAFVIASFLIYSKILRYYYEYVIGFNHDYPNREFIKLVCIGFLFLIITRILLNITEKKLLRE
jgi:hypothetical protein